MPRLKQSAESVRFVDVLRTASLPGAFPRLADIDFAEIRNLLPWIAAVVPDITKRTLKFTMAGAGFAQLLGRDVLGLGYLELVDPAIQGEAFDSAFLMLTRPCGLWQITPALTLDGRRINIEYTGYPTFDHVNGRGQIMCLIHHKFLPVPRVVSVHHAAEWAWLEMRNSPAG